MNTKTLNIIAQHLKYRGDSMKSVNKTIISISVVLALLTLLIPIPSINMSSNQNTIFPSHSNVHRGIIGSYPNGTLWEITQTTIAENMTLTIDKIILYDNTILTLKNCTIYTSDDIDYTTIKFNNHTHLYVYNCTLDGIKLDGIYIESLYTSNFHINFTLSGSSVGKYYSEFFCSSTSYGVINLIYRYTTFNQFYFNYWIDGIRKGAFESIIFQYNYFYATTIAIKGFLTINPIIRIEYNIFDNSIFVPKIPDLAPAIDLLSDYYFSSDNQNQIVIYDYSPEVNSKIYIINNSFVNIEGIYFANFNVQSMVCNNRFSNIGLAYMENGLYKDLNFDNCKNIVFDTKYAGLGNNYRKFIVLEDINSNTPILLASSNEGIYWNDEITHKIIIKSSNIAEISTPIISEGMGFCDKTTIYINDSYIGTLNLVINKTYVAYSNSFFNPQKYTIQPDVRLFVNNDNLDYMLLNNFTTLNVISSSTINQYAIFKNSNITMHSTTFNSLQTFNSTVRADYALTITINSIENTITHIANKTGVEVYTTSQKHFTVRLPSFYIDNATDSITYYYPYKVIVEALSDTGEAFIDPFLSDQNIVISIGTVKFTLTPRGMKDYGWILIPMPTDREVSAFTLLRSSNSIRALVYEIAGTFIYLYKATDGTIYGHDFQIRPYTSVFLYITSQEVEVYLDAVYGNFNDTTLKVHIGYNLIAIPITLTVADFFAYNPAITEIILYNDTGYYTYHKYDNNLNQIFITPERGFIVKCVSSSAYIKLHG